MNVEKGKEIPIFFAVDDGYCPFLAVALQSLTDNASEENTYCIRVLYTDISPENQREILQYEKSNVRITFDNLSSHIEKIADKLYTRDYYSKTTYFRLFIPNLYPQYDKALYLDSDIVILDDIAELYHMALGDALVGAAPDDVIQHNEAFREYAEKVVGVADYRGYFNAGILLMNLRELRRFRFEEKFLYSLEKVRFTVAQDQDYLNRLCRGRVKMFGKVWNRMPIPDAGIRNEDVKLVHYNLAFKPWHFENILYQDFFWRYARRTKYFDKIQKIREDYTETERFRDNQKHEMLIPQAKTEADGVGMTEIVAVRFDRWTDGKW